MFEEASSSLPSMWDSVNSWFTPTVLFIFLNLMICTIAVTSSTIDTQKPPQPNGPETHQPRPLLHARKSISSQSSQQPVSALQKPPESNLHFRFIRSDEQQPKVDRSPPVLLRMKSFNLNDYLSQDPNPPNLSSPGEERVGYDFEQSGRVEDKQTSDEIYSHSYVSGEIPIRAPRKIRKSAFTQFVEEDVGESEIRRPESVKERMAKAMEADEEVDAKADDFINKFKHQLKLQRINSIIRCRTRK